jgi:hypothetical protein
MRLSEPNTVRRFARRGFIGIGGFILPFLHGHGFGAVVHIAPATGESATEGGLITTVGDTGRLVVTREWRPSPNAVPYLVADLYDGLDAAEAIGGPVFLDIDLDYFCNRFDTSGNPGLASDDDASLVALERAQALLASSPLLKRTAVLTIAFSPGFFPGVLWPAGVRFANALRAAFFATMGQNF